MKRQYAHDFASVPVDMWQHIGQSEFVISKQWAVMQVSDEWREGYEIRDFLVALASRPPETFWQSRLARSIHDAQPHRRLRRWVIGHWWDMRRRIARAIYDEDCE